MKTETTSPVIEIHPIALDYKGAARFMGVTVRQVRTLKMLGKLKPLNLGKHVFLVEDLRAFMRALVEERDGKRGVRKAASAACSRGFRYRVRPRVVSIGSIRPAPLSHRAALQKYVHNF